jgi:WD40 repeat protein
VGTGLQETGNVIARNGDAAVHHLSLERGGQRVRVSVTGEDEVTRLSVSPDGRWLAALSYTGFPANTRRDRAAKTLRVWSLASSDTAAVRSLAGLGATTITAAFSTDSRWLATGGSDRAVRLWRLDGSAPLLRPMELRGHENTVTAVQSSGRWLVSGSADARARVWPIDAASPFTEPRVLDGHGNGTRAADFSHDGRWLVTLGGFNELRIWDLRRPNPWQAPVRLHEGSYRIRSVRMTPDSRWVITDLDLDGETFLWRVGHGGVARVPVRLPGAVLAVAPSGRWVATGGLDRPTYLWDLASDRPEQGREPLRVRVRAGVQQMVFSPDGRQLLAVGYDSTAWVWTTQENKWTEARSLGTQDRFARYAFTSDGSRLVGVGQEAVRLLSLKSATTTASRVIADSVIPLFDAEVSPDGQWLLTGMWEQGLLSKTGADRWLRLYDLVRGPQGERSTILVGHRHKVTAVAFSGDGRWLATGSEDSTVHLRELRPGSEGAPPIVLRGAEATILALRFSPDSRRLLATGQDNLARAWYVEEPQEPPVLLAGHKTEVDVVEVSPDGRWVVTGGDDDEARLWRLDTRHLVEVACRVAGRNLTPDEWAEYLPSRNPAATCPALPFTVAAAPTPRPPRQRGGVRQDGIPLAPTRRRTRRKRPDHLFLHLQRGAHRCPDCQRQTGTPC